MISYVQSGAGIREEQLHGFFIGWPSPPSAETHLRLLCQSAHVVIALDSTTAAVVGFVTAISDGVLSASISLLEVLPEYQNQGIGTELMRAMMSRLHGLYMIDLTCDAGLRPFYERFGMQRSQAMSLRNYGRQSGS